MAACSIGQAMQKYSAATRPSSHLQWWGHQRTRTAEAWRLSIGMLRQDASHPPLGGSSNIKKETGHGHGRPGVRPVITQLRTGEVPPISRKGVLFGRRPDRGRPCVSSCDDAQTIDGTPDLCKSGVVRLKTLMIPTASAQHNKHNGLNGVS